MSRRGVFHGTYSRRRTPRRVRGRHRARRVRREGIFLPRLRGEAWLAERAAKVAYDTLQKNRGAIVCANMHLSKARIEEIRPGRTWDAMYKGPQKRREPLGRPLSGTYVRDISVTLHRMFRMR